MLFRSAFMKPMWVDREEMTGFMEKLYMLFAKNTTKASDIAHCLVWAAKNQKEKEKSYTIKEMEEISKQTTPIITTISTQPIAK